MRTLKSAEQRNCKIRKEFYTEIDMRILQEKEPYAVFTLNDGTDYRVALTLCRSISVIYDREYGFYTTVVVTENGNTIYVEL